MRVTFISLLRPSSAFTTASPSIVTMASHAVGDNAISAAPLAATVDAKNRASITSSPAAASLKNDAIATVASNRRWFSWHEPGTSPEEKKLIFKLDWFMLSFACLMFFIKQVITMLPALTLC